MEKDNQELLEELLEVHQEKYGTRPIKLLEGLSETEKLTKLLNSLLNNMPLEYEGDLIECSDDKCTVCGAKRKGKYEDCCGESNEWRDRYIPDEDYDEYQEDGGRFL